MPLAYYGDRLSKARTKFNIRQEYGLDDYVDVEEACELEEWVKE